MSTSAIITDTTRTNQKSQLMDDPYFHSLVLHHELTQLLDTTVFTNKWFSRVSKVLNIRKKDLTNHVLLDNHWNRSWGELSIGYDAAIVFWDNRFDKGPDIKNASSYGPLIKIIRFMLMRKLTEAFKDLNMSSYEKVGVTSNWNRAKVKLNGNEIENVLWADALTGEVTTKAMMEDEKVLTGEVAIYLQKNNLSFF